MKAKILILLSMLLFIIGCSNETNVVKKDFEGKMKIIQSGDLSNMGSIEGNVAEILKEYSNMFGEGLKKITYKIDKVEKDGDAVIVNTTIKTPDISSYMSDFQKVATEKLSKAQPKTPQDMQKEASAITKEYFNEKFGDKDLKYTEKSYKVKYIKDGKEWKMSDENEEFFQMLTFGMANK